MCGIIGAMDTSLADRDLSILRDLLTFSCVRGYTGAGIASVDIGKKSHQARLTKTSGTGAWLANSNQLKNHWKRQPKIVIGHTRWPTTGKVTPTDDKEDKKFVHPVKIDHITGVHNGTFHRVNSEWMDDTVHDSTKFYQHLAKVGIEEAIATSSGGYALVWLDERNKTLNFLRNDQKPLWFASHKTKETEPVFWSSEPGFLAMAIARRANDELAQWEIKQLPADTLISYSVKMRSRKPMVEKELKGGTRIVYNLPAAITARTYDLWDSSGDGWSCDTAPKSAEDSAKRFEQIAAQLGEGNVADLFRKDTSTHHTGTKVYVWDKVKQALVEKGTETRLIADQRHLVGTSSLKHGNIHRMFPASQDSGPSDDKVCVQVIGPGAHSYFLRKKEVEHVLNNGCAGCSNPAEFMDHEKSTWIAKDSFLCSVCVSDPVIIESIPQLRRN